MENIAIVGAGPVGSLLAVLLAKKGYQVDVFERRPDLRKAEAIGGRSINLALSNRGFKALRLANFEAEIREIAIPMYGRRMHDQQGNLSFLPYGKSDEAIFSVSRGELNRKLMNLADNYSNINYHFDLICKDVNFKNNTLQFEHAQTHQSTTFKAAYIFGTDGASSAVRNRLQKMPLFNFSQSYLSHGYKELHFPPTAAHDFCMDKNALHIWPRGEFMMIALPNLDKSFTVTMFFPLKGTPSFESLDTPEKVESFFQETFPDALTHLPTLTDDFFTNPTSYLVDIHSSPWHYQNKALIMGDASHAIVPFYGQGLNAGMEDCSIFYEMLNNTSGDIGDLFPLFSENRIKDADAISELALYNYIEMRDLSGDPDFLLRKKIERKFSDLYPKKWMPLYSQVTFSDTPYSQALKAGHKQDQIMDKIMQLPNIHKNWDHDEVMQKILSLVV